MYGMVYFSATEKSDTSSVSIISPRISAGSILSSMKDGAGVPISVGELLFFTTRLFALPLFDSNA